MTVCELADRQAIPCQGGAPPFKGSELKEHKRDLFIAYGHVHGHAEGEE